MINTIINITKAKQTSCSFELFSQGMKKKLKNKKVTHRLVKTFPCVPSFPLSLQMGSWAGNFAMKIAHRAFPSDVFLSLMAAGAVVKSG